jgi:hypothetical protein
MRFTEWANGKLRQTSKRCKELIMEYEELFRRALKGRSVNQASKDWQMPQGTLARYGKGERIPDYRTAMILAMEAGVNPAEVMVILARLEARKKPQDLFPEFGFAIAAFLTAVTFLVTPPPAEAAMKTVQMGSDSLCIMSN